LIGGLAVDWVDFGSRGEQFQFKEGYGIKDLMVVSPFIHVVLDGQRTTLYSVLKSVERCDSQTPCVKSLKLMSLVLQQNTQFSSEIRDFVDSLDSRGMPHRIQVKLQVKDDLCRVERQMERWQKEKKAIGADLSDITVTTPLCDHCECKCEIAVCNVIVPRTGTWEKYLEQVFLWVLAYYRQDDKKYLSVISRGKGRIVRPSSRHKLYSVKVTSVLTIMMTADAYIDEGEWTPMGDVLYQLCESADQYPATDQEKLTFAPEKPVLVMDKTDSESYKAMLPRWAEKYEATHQQHLRVILSQLDSELMVIAPADGRGTISKIWSGMKYCSDIHYGLNCVEQETMNHTLHKLDLFSRDFDLVLILSFCHTFLDGSDIKLIKEFVSKGGAVIVYDVKPPIFHPMRKENNMVWAVNIRLSLPYFPGEDNFVHPRIPFSSNLLSLVGPYFSREDDYYAYYVSMLPYAKVYMGMSYSAPTVVSDLSVYVQGMSKFQNMYFAPAGRCLGPAKKFDLGNVNYVRTLYTVDREMYGLLGARVYKYRSKSNFYFVVPDGEDTVLSLCTDSLHMKTQIECRFAKLVGYR